MHHFITDRKLRNQEIDDTGQTFCGKNPLDGYHMLKKRYVIMCTVQKNNLQYSAHFKDLRLNLDLSQKN